MNGGSEVLFVVPQGLPGIAAHHEATSGMGAWDLASTPFIYPPHAAAQCAAVTRAAGLSTAVLDAWGGRLSLAETLAQIAASSPRVLAVQVSEGTAHGDETFLRLVRHYGAGLPERKVLLFGTSAHWVVKPWLRAGLADAALLGEPEGGIAAAAAAVAEGQMTGEISAHVLRPDQYDAAGLLTDLDALPFPAWDSVPWQAYDRMASLLGSRGCPDGCRFCAYVVAQGRRVRSQSVERVLAEWEWLAKDVRPSYLMVRDPVFAHDRTRLVALCEAIVARGIVLRWGCESRPEHFDPELLRLMRAAGCEDVKIGLESGDAALLARLGRVPDTEAASYIAQVARVAKVCGRLGIFCRVFVMAGLPGQDALSLSRTIAALRRLDARVIVHALPYQAHPGAELPGPSASVPVETLAALQRSTQPHPPAWARFWQGLRRSAGEWRRERIAAQVLPSAPSGFSEPLPADTFAGMRVFLTGGNGFIGGHVAAALVAAGASVIALVRPGSGLGMLANLPAGSVEVVRGDLALDAGNWAGTLAGCRYCFHVAGRYAGSDQAEAMYAANVHGVAALLDACAQAGVKRVVHTSTVGTVGRPADFTVLPDERTPFNLWHPASHYVRSKYLGELTARAWAAAGLDVVIVRPTAPVGRGDARPTATGARIVAALHGEVTPYPPGGVNHVPVQDVAAGHLLAALRGAAGETYILGHCAGNLDHAAFLRLVAEATGRPPLPAARPARFAGQLPAALTVNPLRAVRELGLPQSDLRAAFAEAVAWFQEHS